MKVQKIEKLNTPVEKNNQETRVREPELKADNPEAKPVDPTRFGDWEKNGRCIDF